MKKLFILSILSIFTLHFQTHAQIFREFLGTGAGVSQTDGNFNVFIGDSSGTAMTRGSYATLVGFGAGRNSNPLSDFVFPVPSEATFIGYMAGYSNTTGFDNTFVGSEAGRLNLTGGDNTFMGTESGENNTTGYDNAFFGEESGTLNTTGYENTFIGEDAGMSNTTGYKQVFIGNEAGISAEAGYRNVGVGSESMSDVRFGHHNAALGDSAAIDIGSGNYNTMIGAASGPATEWADFNTFIGSMSGWDNNRTNSPTNANRNTYVGHLSGASNREGEDNAGLGAFSGYGRHTAATGFSGSTLRSRTTFVGAQAIAAEDDLITMGYYSYNGGKFAIGIGNEGNLLAAPGAIMMGYQFEAGNDADSSIGIGFQANVAQARAVAIGYKTDIDNQEAVAVGASTAVQGNQGIAIGANSRVTAGNSIAIGYGTSVTTSNEVYFGNASTTNIGGAVNWTALSDGRLKENVAENVPGLTFINALRPVTYNYDPAKIAAFRGETGTVDQQEKKETTYTGFIAQEVEEAANVLQYDFSGVKVPENKDTELYGVRYAEFVAPLVKAVQELDAKVKEQQAIIDSQNGVIAQQSARLEGLAGQQAQIDLIMQRLQLLEGDKIEQILVKQPANTVSANQ